MKKKHRHLEETPLKEVVYVPTTYNSEVLKPEMEKKSGSVFLYLSAFVANLIGLMAGIAFGWPSPVLPKLNGSIDPEDNPLGQPTTKMEESLIASLVCVGAICGLLISGPLADRIGRKKTLLTLSCPMGASLLISAFAGSVPLFYFARLLMGLGAGSVFVILPLYLTEIAEDHNRGALGSTMGISVASGLLFSYSVGPFLTVKNFCIVCVGPLFFFFPLFLIWIPESPQYLAMVNDQKSLEESLLKLRNKTPSEVRKEVSDMIEHVQESCQNKIDIKDLFKSKASFRGLIITTGLLVLQQFAGINAVLSYMQTIFNAAGSGLAPEVSTIIIGVIQLITIAVASSIIDRLGRRILLLSSIVGSGLALTALGLFFYLKTEGFDVAVISWLPVSSFVVFIISFNSGMASIPWAVMAELFSPSVKATASTVAGVICFISAFLITLLFPSLAAFLGMAQSFWFFASICAAGTIFIYFMLPETKGRSILEIQKLLEGQDKA